MKKVTWAGILLMGILVSAYSDAQFRLTGDVSNDFSHDPNLNSISGLLNDSTAVNYGFHWEMILKHVGFGMHYLTRFEQSDMVYDLGLKLNTDLFLSYHLFGGGAMLDPFVEIGYGVAGTLDIADGYPFIDALRKGTVSSMSFFPYVAGGVAVDLGGFLVGAKLGYRPLYHPVPESDLLMYPVARYQLGVFGGIALGGHR